MRHNTEKETALPLPTLPADKGTHLAYGAALACIGGFHSVLAGALLCVAFAVGKEAYDFITKKGTPEPLDAAATLVGGALVLLPLAAWRLGVFA